MAQTKIKVKSGNATVEMDPAATKIFTDVMEQAAPRTMRVLRETIDEIYDDAYRVWPVRQRKNLSDKAIIAKAARKIEKEPGYDRARAYAVASGLYIAGELPVEIILSKDSKNKLYTELTIQGDDIFARVGNFAPYAWAIKVGQNTDLPYALGTNVSNELLWKPAKRKANKIVRILAKEMTTVVKRAK
jgi:hypothetical protein